MTFAAPQFFWALLLLPLLWWLSQPPKPKQQIWSGHLEQWQLAMRALHRRPPRGSWLRFWLLSLALLGATLAAAQPFWPPTAGASRLVVLLDASASMNAQLGPQLGDQQGAQQVAQTAFARAENRLSQRLAELPESIEVTVLRCGGDLRRRHGRAARALQDLGTAGGELQVDLVQLAEQTATEACAVWTLTDGQGQQQLPSVGALTYLDTRGNNAAIVAVRATDAWPLPALRLEVDVVAYVAQPASAELHAHGEITAPQQRSLQLAAGVVQTVTLDVQRTSKGGELVLELLLPLDRLPSDNRQVWTLPPLPVPRIAVLYEPDAATFAVAAADALAEEVGGSVVAVEAGVAAGLMLVDGGLLPLLDLDGAVLPRRAVTFGTRLAAEVSPAPWLLPAAIDWSRGSPLTLGLDLSELRIERAWRGILPAGEAFLWSQEGEQREPLAVLVDQGSTASVHFACRLQDSNLPLLPAFPQLLRRAFVASYGMAATSLRSTPLPPASECDLLTAATGVDRDLGPFAEPPRDLARWFVLLGLLALGLRAFVR